jgi:hypothetical protein
MKFSLASSLKEVTNEPLELVVRNFVWRYIIHIRNIAVSKNIYILKLLRANSGFITSEKLILAEFVNNL